VIFYLQGDLMRSEIPGDQATIVTWPPGPDGQRSILAPGKPIFVLDILDRKSLDVMEINFGVNSAAKYKTNPRALQNWFILPEALASIADKEPKLIGKETINGRQTLIYRLGKSFWPGGGVIAEDETAKAWVDAETRLPVRLLLVTNSNGRIAGEPDRRWKDTIDLVDFVWNKPLNPELFKPEIPQGFKVSDKMPGAPEPAK
jgi:hypothetical protein